MLHRVYQTWRLQSEPSKTSIWLPEAKPIISFVSSHFRLVSNSSAEIPALSLIPTSAAKELTAKSAFDFCQYVLELVQEICTCRFSPGAQPQTNLLLPTRVHRRSFPILPEIHRWRFVQSTLHPPTTFLQQFRWFNVIYILKTIICMLQPNPCGEGAECTPGNDRSGSDRPVCLCPSGSRGNPLQRCTKGNYTPKASPMHLFGPYYFYCQLQASVLMMATVAPTGLATTSSVLTLAMMLVELRPSAR